MKKYSASTFLSLLLLLNPVAALTRNKNKDATPPASTSPVPKQPAARPVTPSRVPVKRGAAPQAPAVGEGQTATLLPDGRWLVVGGEAQEGPRDSVAFKDAAGSKSETRRGALRQPRMWHSATLLPDGTVLIYGGTNSAGRATASAELFDPQTGKSELVTAPGLSARAEHTATLLMDGHVLIAGGVDEVGQAVKSIALWDPQTKSAVTLPASLREERRRHTATLTPGGDVLLWGGQDGVGNRRDDGEVYEVSTQSLSWTGARPTPEDDRTPYLVSSSPRDGEASVPRDTHIALRFSKPLRVETFDANNVTLVGQEGKVEASVVPAEGGMLGFVTPREQLRVGASYTLSLNGPADPLGQSLAPATITFTTVEEQEQEHAPKSHDAHGSNSGHDHHMEESPASEKLAADYEGDNWQPSAKNPYADWRSNRGDSLWQKLPPLRAAQGVTALAGQVLKLNGKPLVNVTMQIGDRATRTDATGRFLLTDIPAGHQEMLVNGHTASRAGKLYAMCENAVEVEAGKTNVLPYTIWLPVIDRKNVTPIPVPTTGKVVVTSPLIPGLEVHIPAGVKLLTHHGDYLTSMSLTAMPVDRTPVPLPDGARFFFTPQSHGAEIIGGAPNAGFRVVYPNVSGLPAGASVDLMGYDPERPGGWYVYGKGTVSKNGKQVVPNPGVVQKKLNCYGGFFDSDAPPNGPVPGGARIGDPVDPFTGLFVYDKTDLALSDTMPVTLSRTYRPNDLQPRAFGVGATHPYDMTIIGDNGSHSPSYGELILPDGARIRYERTNPDVSPAAFEHTATPTVFYKSMMVATSGGIVGGWDIRLRDGTTFHFMKRSRGIWIHSVDVYLTGIEDRYGNTVTIQRDDSLRITRITSPNGRWMEFTYDTAPVYPNRIVEARDNLGRTVSYTYDAAGRLWKVRDAKGGVTEYTYDGDNRMLTIKDARGIVYLTNEYDGNGRVFRQTQADGTTYLFSYILDANGVVTATDVTDARGIVRRFTFNASGYTLTETRAVGKPEQQTVTFERQPVTNKVTSMTDQAGRRTEYTYDADGRMSDVTWLAGTASATTTRYTYDPRFDQVASFTDPLQHTTVYGYDDKGNLTSITDHLNHQSTLTYNAAGQLLTATDPLQHTTRLTYDGGDLVEVRDPLGRSVTRFVDAAGRAVSISDALGHVTRYEYDAMNQVTKVTNALSDVTSFSYDSNGNLLSLTDARNKETTFTYDNLDRIETRTDSLRGASSVTRYEYNEAGAPKKVTDRRGKVTTYTYDNLDRLSFAGLGTQVVGGVTSYESTISYTYDAYGRITQAVDSLTGTIARSYDDAARAWSEATPQGTIGYSSDKAGRLTGKTVTGQAAVSYAYDDANHLTGITQGANTVGFTYDDAGRRAALTLPNGVITEYGYDDASQLTSLAYKRGGVSLGDLFYEYDAVGRRTKAGGSFARSLMPQPLASATHDDANRLVQRGGATHTYDAEGNLTSDGANVYTWDARNRLVGIGGGVSATFRYDAFGRRVSKTVNGQTTSYLYDGANVVQEQSGGGAVANLLNGGVDEVILRADSAGAQTPLRGGVGSTLALADSSGTLTTQYTYDPFGATAQSGAASTHSGQYTGRENDQTGLYYYRARYYSPALQRFISEDPIGFAGGDVNLYAYVGNDPVNYNDPSGLERLNYVLMPPKSLAPKKEDWDWWGVFWDDWQARPPAFHDKIPRIPPLDWLYHQLKWVSSHVPFMPGPCGMVVTPGPNVSMDTAVEMGAQHVGGQGTMGVSGSGGYQFINSTVDSAGNTVTKISRFDINPASPHVQQYGPHLNLETQINGVPVRSGPLADPHIPIDPGTIRPGDIP